MKLAILYSCSLIAITAGQAFAEAGIDMPFVVENRAVTITTMVTVNLLSASSTEATSFSNSPKPQDLPQGLGPQYGPGPQSSLPGQFTAGAQITDYPPFPSGGGPPPPPPPYAAAKATIQSVVTTTISAEAGHQASSQPGGPMEGSGAQIPVPLAPVFRLLTRFVYAGKRR